MVKKYRVEIILFLLAFGLRVIFLILMRLKTGNDFSDFVLKGDALSYYNMAFNLKYFFSLHILDAPFFSDALLRTPGYPLFLAAIFSLFKKSIVAVMLIQALLSGLTAILIYKISNLANFHKLVGLSSAILFSMEPMSIITSNSILTETLFLFFFLLFFYLLISGLVRGGLNGKRIFLLGTIIGLSVLIRPVLYPYSVILVLFLLSYLYFYRKIRWANLVKMLVFFAVGIYLLVFPWILRNKIVFNSWSVSSISGVHLFYSYAIPFYAYKHKIPDKDIVSEQFSKKMSPYIVGDKYDLRNNPVYYKFAKEIISDDPLGYAFFHITNTISFFMSNGYRNVGRELGFSFSTPSVNFSFIRLLLSGNIKSLLDFLKHNTSYLATFIAGALVWLLISVFMIAGVVKGLFLEKDRIRKFFILFFAVSIAYFALTAGPEAYYKMRFPVNPLIFILAFYGLFSLSSYLFHKSNKLHE